MPEERTILLADADVLIDYRDSDLSILSLTSKHLASVYVLRHVLDTVDGVTERDCRKLGIKVVETETGILLEAGKRSGSLSFVDWLCFLVCEQQAWIALTNDKALIRECKKARVPVKRGLSLMVDLVRLKVLDRGKALRVAQTIHTANAHHINEQVIDLFKKAIVET